MSDFPPEPFTEPKGVAAILDTSVLVRAWLTPETPNPSRQIMLLAGELYDSFTSPAILEEFEEVAARPRIAGDSTLTRIWVDVHLRASRQVFPEFIPGGGAAAVGGDIGDLPILKTAYAANVGGEEIARILELARNDGGCYIVSENTRDFVPGRNVYGWGFATAATFLRLLRRRRPSSQPLA